MDSNNLVSYFIFFFILIILIIYLKNDYDNLVSENFSDNYQSNDEQFTEDESDLVIKDNEYDIIKNFNLYLKKLNLLSKYKENLLKKKDSELKKDKELLENIEKKIPTVACQYTKEGCCADGVTQANSINDPCKQNGNKEINTLKPYSINCKYNIPPNNNDNNDPSLYNNLKPTKEPIKTPHSNNPDTNIPQFPRYNPDIKHYLPQEENTNTPYTGPPNPYTGPPNPYTGPTNPYTGPTNPYTGPSNPYTGPPNPYTGPTNPYTGPTNPYTVPKDNEMIKKKPNQDIKTENTNNNNNKNNNNSNNNKENKYINEEEDVSNYKLHDKTLKEICNAVNEYKKPEKKQKKKPAKKKKSPRKKQSTKGKSNGKKIPPFRKIPIGPYYSNHTNEEENNYNNNSPYYYPNYPIYYNNYNQGNNNQPNNYNYQYNPTNNNSNNNVSNNNGNNLNNNNYNYNNIPYYYYPYPYYRYPNPNFNSKPNKKAKKKKSKSLPKNYYHHIKLPFEEEGIIKTPQKKTKKDNPIVVNFIKDTTTNPPSKMPNFDNPTDCDEQILLPKKSSLVIGEDIENTEENNYIEPIQINDYNTVYQNNTGKDCYINKEDLVSSKSNNKKSVYKFKSVIDNPLYKKKNFFLDCQTSEVNNKNSKAYARFIIDSKKKLLYYQIKIVNISSEVVIIQINKDIDNYYLRLCNMPNQSSSMEITDKYKKIYGLSNLHKCTKSKDSKFEGKIELEVNNKLGLKTVNQVIDSFKNGEMTISIHTCNYQGGEVNGPIDLMD